MSTIRQRQTSPAAGQREKEQLLREAEEKELTEGQK
jgi:omega-6 fatty acid desaturase (delta-12 desaturase)